MKKAKKCDYCGNYFEGVLDGEWICPQCSKDSETVLCVNCGLREATQIWVGEGGTLAWTHGMGQKWCEICCLFEQIKFAKKQAKRIPELEKKLNDLKIADLRKKFKKE